MSRSKKREKHIHQLLATIHKQRLDLKSASNDWIKITTPYDRCWLTFLGIRRYLVVYTSALAIWSIKNSNCLIRWTKRGISLWNIWKFFRLIKSYK